MREETLIVVLVKTVNLSKELKPWNDFFGNSYANISQFSNLLDSIHIMKKTFITFVLFCLSVTSLFAQEFAGKRIYNGNLSMLLAGNSSPTFGSSNLTLNVSFLTEKIRANNTYTAYGFNFGVTSSTTPSSSGGVQKDYTNSTYSIGPVIQFGKFVKIFDQFYFAPNTTFNVSGIFGSTESPNSTGKIGGFGIGLNISPLNFVCQVKENFLLSIGVGRIGIDYATRTTTVNSNDSRNYLLSVNGNITNFSTLGAYYLF